MRNWIPDLKTRAGPYYLAVADALEEAVRNGVFETGDTLPSQRMLADFLGLHVNTINRAMRESARRGLIRGKSRRGTVIDTGWLAAERRLPTSNEVFLSMPRVE